MGLDKETGTHNSLLFIPSAEVYHGRKHLTQMSVPQGGVPRGRLVEHRQNWQKQQEYYHPDRTPGLADSIRVSYRDNRVPAQTERVRGVYGVAQLPFSSFLKHGH